MTYRLYDELQESGLQLPLGRIVIGAAGAGKTHLMGELRNRIWKQGGWFILLDLADVNEFWADGRPELSPVAATDL